MTKGAETSDPVWRRVAKELLRRKEKHLLPGSWSALGRAMTPALSRGVLNHWRTRGVPAKAYESLADALGWSLDQLLGRQSTPPEDRAATDGEYSSHMQVSDLERDVVAALRALPDEVQLQFAREVMARAEREMAHVEKMMRERYGVTEFASDAKVAKHLPPAPVAHGLLGPVATSSYSASEPPPPQVDDLVEEIRLIAMELMRLPASKRKAAAGVAKVAIGREMGKGQKVKEDQVRSSNAPVAPKPKR